MSQPKELSTLLSTKRELIDREVSAFFDNLDMSDYSRHGLEAIERLKEFSARQSKRVRGILVLEAYEMFGGKNQSEIIKAAIAVELIQNYLLIVDDVMDKSPTRRGGPSVHYQYRKSIKNSKAKDTDHIADMIAINIGLMTAHLASMLITQIEDDPQRVNNANTHFHRNILRTGYGQLEDLLSEVVKPSEEDIVRNYELKSSYYTFINPMQLGAILAGADESDVKAIENFGLPAGVAFQLQDDIISLYSIPEGYSKAPLDDIREGKHTLLIEKALSAATEEQVKTINDALGNEDITHETAEAVRQAIVDTGSKDYVAKRVQNLVKQARDVMSEQTWPTQSKDFLNVLLDFIVNRKTK